MEHERLWVWFQNENWICYRARLQLHVCGSSLLSRIRIPGKGVRQERRSWESRICLPAMGRNDPKLISPRRPPYENSIVDSYKTQGQITKMLKEFGAIDTGWAEKNGQVMLGFTMEAEIKGEKAI